MPGFEKVLLSPKPDYRLSWAKGSYKTKYGQIKSEWKYTDSKLIFDFSSPCKSLVILPNGEKHDLDKGTYHFELDK